MNAYYASGQAFLFVLNYSKSQGICILSSDIPSDLIKFSFNGTVTEQSLPNKLRFDFNCISFSEYEVKFNKIQNHIALGNTYLCNLTQPSKISTNLDIEEIYRYSIAPYKLLIKNLFVVFSPEAFVDILDDKIFTYPMKGTISAEKDENKEILFNDEKENAEHNTIVDLLRNDLSIVAKNVSVDKYKYLQKVETNKGPIWQMSSKISGNIKPEFINAPGSLFDKILPAGSISGAPKEKTLSLLREIEEYDRGYYSGVFGFYNGKSIQSAVMIRFIEQTESGLIYKSGGGITSQSSAAQEYKELIQKIYVPVF